MDRLTHWGRVMLMHICVGNLTIIGPDNGLSPGRHQAIIWTNAGILLIGPLGTNFSETVIEIHTFSFQTMDLKISSAKGRLFCLGLNELKDPPTWLKVATTQEIDLQPWAPRQWTSTTTWWRCGLILLPSQWHNPSQNKKGYLSYSDSQRLV